MNEAIAPKVILDPRRQQAIIELEQVIGTSYPSATFTLRAGIDDPDATYIVVTVDIDDPPGAAR
jgi:hypothetical protein